MHDHVDIVLYPMTDIGGGIFSLVTTAIFLKFWKPKDEWHFDKSVCWRGRIGVGSRYQAAHAWQCQPGVAAVRPHVSPADADRDRAEKEGNSRKLVEPGKSERHGPIYVPGTSVETNYLIKVPTLHDQVQRAKQLRPVGKEDHREEAKFNFAWLTAPGTAVFFAAILSMAILSMSRQQIGRVMGRTFVQMKIPIPTIAFMIGLSYVTRYAGMDATLGVAFASTGELYPFFAPILGWLGVFLTGTDAGSNALFGSLQKITATQIHQAGHIDPTLLTEVQAQILICTANSTGGVMGKMIDAQSICVATAATHQLGKEADIFKAVLWHSILLASIVGLMTLLQAYVYPFTRMVPSP